MIDRFVNGLLDIIQTSTDPDTYMNSIYDVLLSLVVGTVMVSNVVEVVALKTPTLPGLLPLWLNEVFCCDAHHVPL